MQSMIRPALPEDLNVINPGNVFEYAFSSLGPIIAALFLATGLYIYLRREKNRTSVDLFSALTLCFGAGLVNRVFIG